MGSYRVMLRAGLLGIMLLILTGCHGGMGGRLHESAGWKQKSGSLGKVTLIITGDLHTNPLHDDPVDIARAVKSSLEKLPATTVLEDPATMKYVEDLGDRDAIALAKSRGAQSVCVLTVAGYGGRFMIDLLPPGWASDSILLYSFRLLDVDTGELLASCLNYQVNGGWYQFVNSKDSLQAIPRDLRPPLPETTVPKISHNQ